MLNSQERREYVAKKILKWKFLRKHNSETGFYIMSNWAYDDNGRIISMPRVPRAVTVEKLPDFESLPEWVGPICEAVFPMIGDMGWSIFPLRDGLIFVYELTDSDEPKIIIPNRPFVTALIDAHIKITEEKQK